MEDDIKILETLVNTFTEEMKKKLLKKYLQGYTGWDDPTWSPEKMLKALKEHLKKDNMDMIDIANFAMFIWNRQNAIQPAGTDP